MSRGTTGRPPGDPIRRQYEAYPYPARDPADERLRLITGSPSHIEEVDHYVFGGRRDWAQPFRALIAGGGTGDGAIMLAQQLADRGTPAEVVHLDVSRAAQDVARARAEARGLADLRFVEGSLLDLASLGLGRFDYIDCCGVLHHLDDPAAGLGALADALTDDGGLGLMVYGELGRTGVYHLQEMLRLIAPAGTLDDMARLDIARRLLAELPASNWFARNPLLRDHLESGDAGLYDLLLHARDRAFRVTEVETMVAAAGLRVTGFIEPARYDPEAWLDDEALRRRLKSLPPDRRRAFAELLTGNLRKHVCYAVKTDNPVRAPDPGDMRAVPHLRDIDGLALAAQLPADCTLAATQYGLRLQRKLPPLAPAILKLIDGRRSLADIHAILAAQRSDMQRDRFLREFGMLYRALNGIGRMHLSYPPSAVDDGGG